MLGCYFTKKRRISPQEEKIRTPHARCVWECHKCGRTVILPDSDDPEFVDRALGEACKIPCGHNPFRANGHLYLPDRIDPTITRYRCALCGLILEIANYVAAESIQRAAHRHQPCATGSQTEQVKTPNTFQMATNYAAALTRWAMDGFRARDQAEIERLYVICQACEFFDAGDSRCTVCGCRVATDPNPVRNKLAMPTEACPKGKW